MTNEITGPHQRQPVLTAGQPLSAAKAAMIMTHGRGASAEDILTLIPHIDTPGFAYLAPQAANDTWYPHSFLAPIAQNEPGLSSGLAKLGEILAQIVEAGIPAEKVILLGFSQGACLSIEFVARNARRYGGVAVLSGGLIGPDDTPRDYEGAMDGTPVFLGCSDVDFHIPLARVQESTAVMQQMGAAVTERIYHGMGHTINEDELLHIRNLMKQLVAV